jgi:hypothetical protein
MPLFLCKPQITASHARKRASGYIKVDGTYVAQGNDWAVYLVSVMQPYSCEPQITASARKNAPVDTSREMEHVSHKAVIGPCI